MRNTIALASGLALAPSTWSQSVTVDDRDMGPHWSPPRQIALGAARNPKQVIVDGIGATWISGTSIAVGYRGKGELIVRNGGRVQSTFLNIGDLGGTGVVTISGPGSILSTVDVQLGLRSQGTLSITHGGTLVSQDGRIGLVNGNASVTVDGEGSTWTAKDDIFIGAGEDTEHLVTGTGLLTIRNGGKVSADLVSLGNKGFGNATLRLETYGVLEARAIEKATALGRFSVDAGLLRATHSTAQFLKGFARGDIAIGSGGLYLDTQHHEVAIGTAGIFTGSGALTKLGSGELHLAGGNTWGGDTFVQAGTLWLDSYTQGSHQRLVIGASNTAQHGRLRVTGTASFGPDALLLLNVSDLDSLAPGQRLANIISADTLDASTFILVDNSALFDFEIVREGNSISLHIPSIIVSGIFDATQAQSRTDAYAAARILDTWLNAPPVGSDMADVVTAFGQLPDQRSIADAVGQTLPRNVIAAATLDALATINHIVEDRADSRASGLSSGNAGGRWQTWIKPFGLRTAHHDCNPVPGFSANTRGVVGALEQRLGQLHLGLAYAHANTRAHASPTGSGTRNDTRINTNVLAFYGNLAIHGMVLGLQLDGGWSDNRNQRDIRFGSLQRAASSRYRSWNLHAGGSLALPLALGPAVAWTPALRLDYTRIDRPAYHETGAAALNLNVQAKKTEVLTLGLQQRITRALSSRSRFEASLGAGYDVLKSDSVIHASYAGSPELDFATMGASRGPWHVRAGLGYAYQASNGVELAVSYTMDRRGGYQNQSASIKARWNF